MEKTFKLGDKVKIVMLDNYAEGGRWMGTKGHVGKVIKIDTGDGPYSDLVFYYLEPSCVGICWPAECLEYVKPPKKKKIKGVLFNIDDL